MKSFEIIKCHGSGNDFVMVDTTIDSTLTNVDWSHMARLISDRSGVIGSDGILLLVCHNNGVYGMDMLNPDGTHAEMCGNGIRCVARLAMERGYIQSGDILRSGGRDYKVQRAEDIYCGIVSFAVDIPIRRWSKDFNFFNEGESFVGGVIAGLDDNLRFTALNPGNPHIVAEVESIDMLLLEALGERVKSHAVCKKLFPNGVNVSLYEKRGSSAIYVSTYERGAGITMSCGTAMTSSSTAATLLGIVDVGSRVEVCNRGGKVYCTTTLAGDNIVTRLEGNATFEWRGELLYDGRDIDCVIEERTSEARLWDDFVKRING